MPFIHSFIHMLASYLKLIYISNIVSPLLQSDQSLATAVRCLVVVVVVE